MQKSSTHKKNENIDLFVGLDVHKETLDIAVADDGRTAEVRHYGKSGVLWLRSTRCRVNSTQLVARRTSSMRPGRAVMPAIDI